MIKFNSVHTVKIAVAVLAAASVAIGVSACTPPNQKDSAAPSTQQQISASASAAHSEEQHGDIHMHDGVVRAMEAGQDMTAIFGTIHNSTDKDITITGFSSSVDASMQQIHEVVNGVMQQKQGGLTVPAGESVELAPGGNHFMLMGVSTPVLAGESVELSIILSDGSTVDLGEVPVRSLGAGAEGYEDIHSGHAAESTTALSH